MDEKDIGRELMLRLQKGDQEAFTEIVQAYERMVLNFAYRYLGDQGKAEDVAQETFLRVYRTRHSWRPEAKFRVWLLTIVSRLCMNQLRSAARERRFLRFFNQGEAEELYLNKADSRSDPPAENAISNERAEIVRSAVAQLGEKQRAVLLLHQFEGLSYEEVAEALGITVGAVRSLLVRARRNLRRMLKPLLGADTPLSEGVSKP